MIEVRELVTVAEVTTSTRGLAAEVAVEHSEVGLERPSVINCDGIHTVAQAALTGPVGAASDDIMRRVCSAINHALGSEDRRGPANRGLPCAGRHVTRDRRSDPIRLSACL